MSIPADLPSAERGGTARAGTTTTNTWCRASRRVLAVDARFTGKEAVVASLMLMAFAWLLYAPHILHGALYLDDFSNGAGTLYPDGGPGLGHVLAHFVAITLYRPVLVVYVPLTFLLFGASATAQLALAALLAVVVAICAYGVLRTLRLPALHSGIVAALILAYPWYDSLRMWATASQASLAIAFALAGAWVALVGLRHHSRRAHAVAAALYLLSILTYEITIPAVLGAGLLYVARFGWRESRSRWLTDVVVAAFGVGWVYLLETHKSFGVAADLTHAREIASGGLTILGRSVVAVGLQPRTAVAVAALVFIVMIGVLLNRRSNHRPRQGVMHIGGWLWMVAGGLGVAVLGWIIFIPADPYYTPVIWGFTNRVNAVAGLGLILVVYGALGILGSALAILTPWRTLLATVLTVGLATFLGATYVRVLERHSRIWNTAGRFERAGMSKLKSEFPRLPAGTMLLVGGYPANETLGVPIYSTDWDLNGLVQLTYRTRDVSAYPILPGLRVHCGAAGASLTGPGAPARSAPYGHVWLVELSTGRRVRPNSAASCTRSAPGFSPGPLYLTATY